MNRCDIGCITKRKNDKIVPNRTMIKFLFCTVILLCPASAVRLGLPVSRIDEHVPEDRDLQIEVVGTVDTLLLIHSGLDEAITSLRNGAIINTTVVRANRFNIQAMVSGNVQSIKFGHNDKALYNRENGPTYAFCGHDGTNFFRCDVLGIGEHTITATPYTERYLNGIEGTTLQISFSIVGEQISNAPVSIPAPFTVAVPAPVSAPVHIAVPISCKVPKLEYTWDRYTPDYPIGTAESQAEMVGTNLFIAGGFINDFSTVTNHTYTRDISIANSPWRQMDDMPSAIGITHAAVVVIGMKVYMCGGFSGVRPGTHVPNCFVYDHTKAPGRGQWSSLPNLPNGGSGGGGMIYDSAKKSLYYAGGGQRRTQDSLETTDISDTWKFSFDMPNLGWVPSTPFPYKANHLSAVTSHDSTRHERHYFLGGQKSENELDGNVDDSFEFLSSTETWIRRASLPSARSHTTASTRAMGCGFIMAGGSLNSLNTRKNRTAEILYYDIPTNRWTTIGDIPQSGATPQVFVGEDEFMYYVSNRRTSRTKITL